MKTLETIYDNRKSFYNKAKTEEKNGKLVLYSYDTADFIYRSLRYWGILQTKKYFFRIEK